MSPLELATTLKLYTLDLKRVLVSGKPSQAHALAKLRLKRDLRCFSGADSLNNAHLS